MTDNIIKTLDEIDMIIAPVIKHTGQCSYCKAVNVETYFLVATLQVYYHGEDLSKVVEGRHYARKVREACLICVNKIMTGSDQVGV